MPETRTKLCRPRRFNRIWANDDRYELLPYREAAPFFTNPRGVLTHRVRALYRVRLDGREWWIVDYWCENGGRSEDVDNDLQFDPGERFVCARCEAKAVAAREKTSSELAGRHACIGVCVPVNVCPEHRTPNDPV